MDITIVPELRSGGIGTLLFERLMAEADASGRTLSIHVDRYNRAHGLYKRLGFRKVGDFGMYLLMERAPSGRGATDASPHGKE
jgi:predicted GNAT family acetyltransferase